MGRAEPQRTVAEPSLKVGGPRSEPGWDEDCLYSSLVRKEKHLLASLVL
jgi:hypothetical protein